MTFTSSGPRNEDKITVSYGVLDALSIKLLLAFIIFVGAWSIYISFDNYDKFRAGITASIPFIFLSIVILRSPTSLQQIGKHICVVALVFHSIGDFFLVATSSLGTAIIFYGIGHLFYIARQVLIMLANGKEIVLKNFTAKAILSTAITLQGTLMLIFLLPSIPTKDLIIIILYSVLLVIEIFASIFNILSPVIVYGPFGVYLYLLADIALLLNYFDVISGGYAAVFYYPTYYAGNALIVTSTLFDISLEKQY